MKIPDNLDEEYVINTISKIAKKLAPKYTFACYEVEDIEQEAFLIGLSGLEKYDESRPLENFMYIHIGNRLKTFKRDNYYRLDYGNAQKIQDRKKSLLEPIDITALYSICTQDNISNEAQISEILNKIDEKLPPQYRRDYIKLRTNSSLPKGRKAEIIRVIDGIINGEIEE
jgi:DNA-directed RNA polymerase specialized sigma24 family protein